MITDIRLQQFRSYGDAAFEFTPGVNIVVGPNASGKTNLLEAVLMIARGRTYKPANAELVKVGHSWARLDAHTSSGGLRTVKLKQEPKPEKSFEIDNVQIKRLPITKTIPTVLFEPQHMMLLTGRPDLRRDYLDDLLEQTTLDYAKTRRDYKRSIQQRNALLKMGPSKSKNQLFAWNIRASELGGAIYKARNDLIANLNEQVGELYKKLSLGKVKIHLNYLSSLPNKNYTSQLLHKLEQSVDQDYMRGFTAYGPHREDLQVLIDDKDAQTVASRGEVRTILLALKILELNILEKLRGQKPMLLLDDVFSELDGTRRRALTDYLKDYQSFISTTDADIITKHFTGGSNLIATTSGKKI